MSALHILKRLLGISSPIVTCDSCSWRGTISQADKHELDEECCAFTYSNALTFRHISVSSVLSDFVVGMVTLGFLRTSAGEIEEVYVKIRGLTCAQLRYLERIDGRAIIAFEKKLEAERLEAFKDQFAKLAEERWANCGECGGQFIPWQDRLFERLLKTTCVDRIFARIVNDPAKSGLFCSQQCERVYKKRTVPQCRVCHKRARPKLTSLAESRVCTKKCLKDLAFAHTCRCCKATFTKKPRKSKVSEWHESGFCSERCAAEGAVLDTDDFIDPEIVTVWRMAKCPGGHESDRPADVRYPFRTFCEPCQLYFEIHRPALS